MKKITTAAIVSIGMLISAPSVARGISVEITNLTNGTYFTPLLVAAHHNDTYLFRVGDEATAHLQAMAEGGDISGLQQDVSNAGGVSVANPAQGLLAPGESTEALLDVNPVWQGYLSVVGMLLPTNDGFVGLDSLAIPRKTGTYTYYLNGYDAGTEANDEIINGAGAPGAPGIPADPGGNGGADASGAAGPDHNTRVHIHRGVLGDSNPVGGVSDLDSNVHRWLNPVARLVIQTWEPGSSISLD